MLRYFFNVNKVLSVDSEINAILKEMSTIGVNSSNYPTMIEYYEQLSAVKARENKPHVSKDTIALIVGNLVGIVLILMYEQKHVLTSKSLNRVLQLK